ncbi:glycosyltransferase family 4 protein [Microvirga sp. 0TCS3.31]
MDGDVSWPYSGARTVFFELFKQILQHATDVDLIVVTTLRNTEKLNDRLSALQPSQRHKIMTPSQFVDTKFQSPVIFKSLDADLSKGQFLRACSGLASSPVVGITHDLSDAKVYRELFVSCATGVRPYDSIVSCSHAAKNVLDQQLQSIADGLGLPAADLFLPIIPYGVDLEARFPQTKNQTRAKWGIAQDAFLFLFVGRICRLTKADLEALVLAFDTRFRNHEKARLIISGSVGSESEAQFHARLSKLVQDRSLDQQIGIVVNPTNHEKCSLYAAADIFVSPANSLQESFGITLLEAMMHGLPVLGSDWDGYRDIIVDGQTGFTFPTNIQANDAAFRIDYPFLSRAELLESLQDRLSLDSNILADLMAKCESSRDECKEMGKRAQQRVHSLYRWDKVVQKHVELWFDLLHRSSSMKADDRSKSIYPDLLKIFSGHASHVS